MKKLLIALIAILLVIGGIVWVISKAPKTINPLVESTRVYELLNLLEKNGMYPSSIPFLSGGAIQASISGILVSFAPDKDFSQQIRALQLVLSKVKMDGKTVSEIDLRFNKIVIKN